MGALYQLAIMWTGVYAAVWLAEKTRLTPVLWYLFVGCVFVNSGILPTQADPFIREFSELGIITIMFALGFEENTSKFIASIKRSWGIAFFGALAPFIAAFAVAQYFWGITNLSIMFGLTMTATAVSLTMVSLKSEGLSTSNAAMGIMTSAVLDDIASLALVAILVPIAAGDATVSAAGISTIVGKAILFFVVITLIGAVVFPHNPKGIIAKIPFINKYGLFHFLKFARGEYAILTVMTVAVWVGFLAHEFGFHPAVGAYMAGLIVREEYFLFGETPGGNRYGHTKEIIENVAFTWIGPIFFVFLGAQILIDWDILISIVPHTIVLTASILVAQILSAGLAARYTGNFAWHESWMIGFGMLGRAELAFVVMDIAYIQNQILNTEAFYTLMIAAFFLNVAVPVTIRLWRPHYDRQERLLREPGEPAGDGK
ncbi:MAG: cation:proton antiporter [Alphaproteobacteria bacterium]|nr:MAG: cation:proton antiporter [Alphaproteobacteria bacterium]